MAGLAIDGVKILAGTGGGPGPGPRDDILDLYLAETGAVAFTSPALADLIAPLAETGAVAFGANPIEST